MRPRELAESAERPGIFRNSLGLTVLSLGLVACNSPAETTPQAESTSAEECSTTSLKRSFSDGDINVILDTPEDKTTRLEVSLAKVGKSLRVSTLYSGDDAAVPDGAGLGDAVSESDYEITNEVETTLQVGATEWSIDATTEVVTIQETC